MNLFDNTYEIHFFVTMNFPKTIEFYTTNGKKCTKCSMSDELRRTVVTSLPINICKYWCIIYIKGMFRQIRICLAYTLQIYRGRGEGSGV